MASERNRNDGKTYVSDRKICCVLDRPLSPLRPPVAAGGGGEGAEAVAEAEALYSIPLSLLDEGAASTAGLKARMAAAVDRVNCILSVVDLEE